jgi:hypothetical protein
MMSYTESEIRAFEAEVDDIRANTVASNSRKIYHNYIAKFIKFCVYNEPSLITEELQVALGSPIESEAVLDKIRLFCQTSTVPPIKLSQLTAKTFVMFLVSLRKSNTQKPGKSVYNSHRSALFNLYRDFRHQWGHN